MSQKQISEMKSRLYLNLGLTLESEGDIFSGVDHVAKVLFFLLFFVREIFS